MAGKIKKLEELSPRLLHSSRIILCSEESIRCRSLPLFQRMIQKNSHLLIAMPAGELKKGLRGFAKAQILLSIKGIEGIISCSPEDFEQLVEGEFGKIEQIGKIPIRGQEKVFPGEILAEKIKVNQTKRTIDQKFINQAKRLISESNCWWRPTACLFVRDKKTVIKGVSFNPWKTRCQELTIKPTEIELDSNERISFCNAIHAEAEAIAQAARRGISLEKTTLYITTCPCEECAKLLTEIGVKRVVFSGEYYDRRGLLLLKKYRIKIAKVKNDTS